MIYKCLPQIFTYADSINIFYLFRLDNIHFIKPYRNPVYLKPAFGKVL